jgi:hypothetical protein
MPILADQLRGVFKLESTSIVVNEDAQAIQDANDAVRSIERLDGVEALAPRYDPGNSLDLRALLPMLTLMHEQDHFKILSSTPVGLLLWRIEQCLSVDAFYLRRRLPTVSPDGHATLLDAWAEAAKDSTSAGEHAATVQLTAEGAIATRTFLALLLLHSDVTIGDFITIANFAFAYLALRSGLEPGEHAHWDSRLDKGDRLVGPGHLSLMEIIEASARTRELTNLQRWRVTQSILDSWRGNAIFGVYAPGFSYLMSQLGSAAWAKTAIDVALGAPIDLCAGRRGDVLYVEDILPAHRLPRIVSGLRSRMWNLNMADRAQATSLYDDLPHSVGLAGLGDTYRHLCEVQYSLQANWGGAFELRQADGSVLTGAEADQVETDLNEFFGGESYLAFVEAQYRRNFQLRADDPTHFITPQLTTLHQPILIFCRDRLAVCTAHLENQPRLLFAAFNHFCDREIGRAYVYSSREADLTSYERLFQEYFPTDDSARYAKDFLRIRSLLMAGKPLDGGSVRDELEAHLSDGPGDEAHKDG